MKYALVAAIEGDRCNLNNDKKIVKYTNFSYIFKLKNTFLIIL